MTEAVQTITAKYNPDQITPEIIKEHLYTRELPPVDFVIRTGGEPHFSSGFMMWDVADAQLYFTEKLWPDFSREELIKALTEFERRERRKGK
jgi:undecaprenyl diphosphate synthase